MFLSFHAPVALSAAPPAAQAASEGLIIRPVDLLLTSAGPLEDEDPIITTLLASIMQRAAPILVNNNLWDKFCGLRASFHLGLGVADSPQHVFLQFYEKLTSTLATAAKSPKIMHDARRTFVLADVLDNLITTRGTFLQKLKEKIGDAFKAVNVQFVCYQTSLEQWHVFENEYVHLLIPPNYPWRIAPHILSEKTIVHDAATGRELDHLERLLNMKINNLRQVSPLQQLLPVSRQSKPITSASELEHVLRSIFVHASDIVRLQPSALDVAKVLGITSIETPLTPENIRMMLSPCVILLRGHGLPGKKAEEARNKQHAALRSLGAAIGHVATQEPRTTELGQTTHAGIAAYRKQQRELFDILDAQAGTVASLSMSRYKALLKFFNDDMNTLFLLYVSCLAGGTQLNLMFDHLLGRDTYNYPIVVSSVGDMLSVVPDNFDLSCALWEHIKDDQLVLTPRTDLAAFFNQFDRQVRGYPTESLAMTVDHVNRVRTVSGTILRENIPAVRRQGSQQFLPLYDRSMVEHINTIRMHVATKTKTPITTEKPIIILSKTSLEVPLEITGKKFPTFIPALPGKHVYAITTVRALQCSLSDIIRELVTLKLVNTTILIDSLDCLNDMHMAISHKLGLPSDVHVGIAHVRIQYSLDKVVFAFVAQGAVWSYVYERDKYAKPVISLQQLTTASDASYAQYMATQAKLKQIAQKHT